MIIYLACGAPFGVHYFFSGKTRDALAFFKSAAVSLFWLPAAFQSLHREVANRLQKTDFDVKSHLDSDERERIERAKKRFEQFIPKNRSGLIFEFRELIERYSGLVRADRAEIDAARTKIGELFPVSGHRKPELGMICLNRRNRLRLKSHLSQARGEFVELLATLFNLNVSRKKELSSLAREFVKLLDDTDALDLIESLFNEIPQEDDKNSVIVPEKVLWNLKNQSLSTTKPNSKELKTRAAIAMLRKDG